MFSRRGFTSLLSAGLIAELVGRLDGMSNGSKLTVNGDFGFRFENGSLTMNVKNATIDGLNIPAFTWKWIGLAIGQAVLSGFGGVIFNALANAIFGHEGKSIEQLLNEQLAEIAKIIQDALLMNSLRQYQADIDAFGRLYREFLNKRTPEKLDFLLNNSAVTLSRLSTTGFPGYRTYMIGTGLRLAALEDEMKLRHTTPKSFNDQIETALEFHRSIAKIIQDETNSATVFARFGGGGWNRVENFRYGYVRNQKILSEPLDGVVIVRADTLQEATEGEARLLSVTSGSSGPNFDQWASLARIRQKLLFENTDIGDKIIARWKAAKFNV